MHIEPRNGASIDRIYLHKNEGDKGIGAAFGLQNYLLHNGQDGGGYHVIVDSTNTVRVAADDQVVWAEGGDNEHCLSVCLIGFSAAPWGDPYDWAQFERAAQQVATWCKQYNIPVVYVPQGASGQAPTARGIAEHAEDHDPLSQGHTDPGTFFPIESFIQRVAAILGPPPPNPAVVKAIVDWLAAMKTPAILGERSDKVASLNDWLIVNGAAPQLKGDAYGVRTQQAVGWFKALWKLPSHDNSTAGEDLAVALVSHAAR